MNNKTTSYNYEWKLFKTANKFIMYNILYIKQDRLLDLESFDVKIFKLTYISGELFVQIPELSYYPTHAILHPTNTQIILLVG